MPLMARYLTTLWVLGAAAYAAVTIAFLSSIKTFSPAEWEERGASAAAGNSSKEAAIESIDSAAASSELAGAPIKSAWAENTASDEGANDPPAAAAGQEWVEVEAAVNMRSGPSSSNPILTVQPKGATLMVLSREQNWVEVVEPENELRGWVFSRYVKGTEHAIAEAGPR
jgi:uncharacterized protein YgiM (DUF1202 family)